MPVQQIEFLGLEKWNYFFLKKGRRGFSDISKCNGRQFDFKEYDKATGEIDFHSSSNFTSKTSDSFPVTDTYTVPQNKYDRDYSGPGGQKGAAVVDSNPRPSHIFKWIEEGLAGFVSRDYHGGSMVFSGESLARKCSKIGNKEASNSFIYKI